MPRVRRLPRPLVRPIVTFALALASFCATANDTPAEVQAYREATTALSAGDRDALCANLARLDGSPLAPYLRLRDLLARLETVTVTEVERFLSAHRDHPTAAILREQWLPELVRREEWTALLDQHVDEAGVTVRCGMARALAAAGRHDEAVAAGLDLWRVPYRQPEVCMPVFDYLALRGELTPARVEERIRMALERGRARLARQLLDRLPEERHGLVENWIALVEQPLDTLATAKPLTEPDDRAWRDTLLVVAMRDAARHDPAAARETWQRLQKHYRPDEQTAVRIERRIALQAAWNRLPQALTWLKAVPDDHATATVHAWRTRAALRAGDWPAVKAAIDAMPESQRGEARWVYWRAHALNELGRTEDAERAWRSIADEFDYYGFLAADRIGATYHWGEAIAPPDGALQTALRERPVARRALLLHAAGEHEWAQAAWRTLVRGLPARERVAASRIAHAETWPWAALYASSSAGMRNASLMQFPLGFGDTVTALAGEGATAQSWLFALIRQESTFRAGACSSAGACGLMQLMPATAQWMRERSGMATGDVQELMADPAENIATGTAYLAYLEARFEHPVLALAAYNAGPGNVERWLGENAPTPASPRWIETLTFGETREYVKSVLFNQVVYRLRTAGSTNRLSASVAADASDSRPRVAER